MPRLYEPWTGQTRSGTVIIQWCEWPPGTEQHALTFASPAEAEEWLTQALAQVRELPGLAVGAQARSAP